MSNMQKAKIVFFSLTKAVCLCVCFIVSVISQIKLKNYMYVGELPMFGISVNRSTSNIPSEESISACHLVAVYMRHPVTCTCPLPLCHPR